MATDMGEWSETKDATEETQKICDQVKDQMEKKTGKNYGVYTAIKYRDLHLIGGTHYLIKVHVGGADYIHLSVIQFIWLLRCVQEVDILNGVEQHRNKDAPPYLSPTDHTTCFNS
ncbi:cystatin-B-like isoform X6 [Epinephelus fuscoguttatus]|uniref:cystatin-B-like isoform X6 n=1 Tax=Epinephelus fuscoguttatus TaxID=293821 RepID=UPI0020D00D0F|nr:cystatin-B-like isoform X6 [Epinephelus fuscoguttatus]